MKGRGGLLEAVSDVTDVIFVDVFPQPLFEGAENVTALLFL